MATFNISIPDQKVEFFKELIDSLGFAKIEIGEEPDIPEHHKEILDHRLKHLEENPDSLRKWEDVKKELDEKYNV
ncbi:MAG: addiction module protein [Bacteroidota bacterium]